MKFYTIITLQALLVGAQAGSKRNRIAGVWDLESASAITGNETIHYLGDNPYGMLVFTDSGFFTVQINRGDLPRFPGEDIGSGTDEDIITVAQGTFGISGTYEVDENGDFRSQVVEGCSFPNSIGLYRDTSLLRFIVSACESTLQERIVETPDAYTENIWRRRAQLI
ncbi:hypothetical protein NM208_g8920 [Fusarium decemcellulare]|uniref:Uncharacterized protein n=1 Tax=Fusarium decemcellulare TaxID=57161 RepID=A0ACC1S3Q2_9HYPO|nr:hypothetical protein NM208_g8920 [Fusarium decemcellulare]